jgi:WG containing repeat
MEPITLIPFNNAGKWGYCNRDREIVIPCEYDLTHFFQDDLAIVRNGVKYDDWHYGMINRSGEVVIPLEYSRLEPFSDGLAKMRSFGKTLSGFLDSSSFAEGLAFVRKPVHKRVQEVGFIDTEGVMRFPTPFSDSRGFHEGFAILEHEAARGTYFSYLQRNGQTLTSQQPRAIDVPQLDWLVRADEFHNGLALVLDEFAGFSIISTLGEIIVNFGHRYDGIWTFHNDCAKVRTDAGYGFIDWAGKEIIPCMIDFFSINNFYDGRAAFQETEHGKYGCVDKALNTVIPCRFETEIYFSEGLACVQRGDVYGFINTDGEEVIPFQYKWAGSFGESALGFAWARKNGLQFFIDREGREYASFG